MAQIWFKIDGHPVNVSSHGYFTVYAKAPVPTLKFSIWPCGGIYRAGVSKLNPGLVYSLFWDDIVFRTPKGKFRGVFGEALAQPELKDVVKRWLTAHAKEIADLDKEAQTVWKIARPEIELLQRYVRASKTDRILKANPRLIEQIRRRTHRGGEGIP